jgi:iron complex transport system substrate-binding protein
VLIKRRDVGKSEIRLSSRGFAAGCVLTASLHIQAVLGGGLTDGTACEVAPDSSRIVVAGGSITEILFLLGEEEKIVAVDRTSDYPAQASNFPVIGYVRGLSAEGVLSLEPSLVLGEDDMGPIEVVAQLGSTGISIRRIPEHHSARGVVDKIICVAEVLGHTESERGKIKKTYMEQVSEIARIGKRAPADQRPKVAVIMALRDGVPFAAGRGTSADGVIEMAGGENVFSDFEGWKPVSLELMVGANPSVIVMPERGLRMSGGRESVLAHPSVRVTSAAKQDGLIVLDGMTLLGFGPRTLQASIDLSMEFERVAGQER